MDYQKLPCALSVDERASKSDELAREIRRRTELEMQKATETRRLGDLIKRAAQRILDLGEEVRTGVEVRDVPVTHEKRAGRLEVVRTDTGEVVSTRPLTAEERQMSLGELTAAARLLGGPGEDEDDEDDDDDDEAVSGRH